MPLRATSLILGRLVEISDYFADEDYTGFVEFNEVAVSLDRLHEHYRPLVELAANFNFTSGVGLGSTSSKSLLLPTWQLFEGACRAEVANYFSELFVNTDSSFTRPNDLVAAKSAKFENL